MTKKNSLSGFNPKQVTKKLLSALPDRAKDVIVSRFGLGKDSKKMTLEAIGKKYNITRERVRQIESYSLKTIRKSKQYQENKEHFEELKHVLKALGGIIKETDLLEHLSKNKGLQNHIHFMLVVGEHFKREKEDEEFHHRWHVDQGLSEKIHNALRKLYQNLSDDEILPESELVKDFLNHLKDISDEYKNEEVMKRWLSISKKLGKNPLGEWGKSHSSNIKAKGVRDYAYLVIRRHGSPIHFKEVAHLIEQVFKKKAHVATTHNELIKDSRFVLVGRGLYALTEWGYMKGVVKDVIKKVLDKHGPLSKDEIIDKVLKERYVKENTILVNLQNPKHFKKDKAGRYQMV
jgi:hypothetical protein